MEGTWDAAHTLEAEDGYRTWSSTACEDLQILLRTRESFPRNASYSTGVLQSKPFDEQLEGSNKKGLRRSIFVKCSVCRTKQLNAPRLLL